MSRKPGYLNKLPPELAEDPFWANFHKPPPTSFGMASRRLSAKDLPDDHEYHLRKEIDQWEHVDGHLVRHGRLQVESRWGTVKSPAPGDYDPDADKRSKMPSFPSPIITRREPDPYFEELTLARSQPIYTFRVATANAIKRQQSQKKLSTSHGHQRGSTSSSSRGSTLHSAINDPESPSASHTLPHALPSSSSGTRTRAVTPAVTKSEWRDVNVEDMKKGTVYYWLLSVRFAVHVTHTAVDGCHSAAPCAGSVRDGRLPQTELPPYTDPTPQTKAKDL